MITTKKARREPRRAVMNGCMGPAGRVGISCGAPRPLQRCEQ
jgi:hypothetical protein